MDTQAIIRGLRDGSIPVYEIGRKEIRALDDGAHSDETSETLDAAQGDADEAGKFSIIVIRGEPLI